MAQDQEIPQHLNYIESKRGFKLYPYIAGRYEGTAIRLSESNIPDPPGCLISLSSLNKLADSFGLTSNPEDINAVVVIMDMDDAVKFAEQILDLRNNHSYYNKLL